VQWDAVSRFSNNNSRCLKWNVGKHVPGDSLDHYVVDEPCVLVDCLQPSLMLQEDKNRLQVGPERIKPLSEHDSGPGVIIGCQGVIDSVDIYKRVRYLDWRFLRNEAGDYKLDIREMKMYLRVLID